MTELPLRWLQISLQITCSIVFAIRDVIDTVLQAKRPFLKMAVTFASFQEEGRAPPLKDCWKREARIEDNSNMDSFSARTGI